MKALQGFRSSRNERFGTRGATLTMWELLMQTKRDGKKPEVGIIMCNNYSQSCGNEAQHSEACSNRQTTKSVSFYRLN